MNLSNKPHIEKVLGVDFGGVIAELTDRDSDTSFFKDNYLNTPAVDGSFAALAAANTNEPYAGNVHIVSKAGPETEEKTRKWLESHNFHEQTGIPPDHLHFTPTRDGKAAIAEALGITAFIDDKAEVLGYVAPTVAELFLFNPKPGEAETGEQILERTTVVHDWQVLQNILIKH